MLDGVGVLVFDGVGEGVGDEVPEVVGDGVGVGSGQAKQFPPGTKSLG